LTQLETRLDRFSVAECVTYTPAMDRAKKARNVAIVLLLATAVYLLPGGGRAASTFQALLYVAFGVGIGYLGLRLYREHRIALYSLGERYRGLLYGALGLGMFAITARARMWQSGLGELVWFVLIGAVVCALVVVYQRWRAY
jgi:hypothetical protein